MTTDLGRHWDAMMQRSGGILNIGYILCIAIICYCNSYFCVQLKFEALSDFP